MKRVCVCAHFGEGKEMLNGQSVKAHIITREVEKQLGKDQVIRIDTHRGILSIIQLAFLLLRALIICENTVIMPGENGLRVFIPMIWLYNIFLKRKIHYIVIGGWLNDYLQNHILVRKLLYKCDYIYVETNEMKTDLESSGYQNIVILPNCKDLHILTEAELIQNLEKPFRLCTFSRVVKEKGIEDAISAVTGINRNSENAIFTLDIYGPIDDNYRSRFEEMQEAFPEYIRYCGTVPYDKTTEIIKEYLLMLFPTHYETEGLPGTLIDAYASGVPIVASNWKYCREFIDDEVGYIFDFKDVQALTEVLDNIKDDINAILKKKLSCIKRAHCYSSESVLKILIRRF